MKVHSYSERLSLLDTLLANTYFLLFLIVPYSRSHVGYHRSLWLGSIGPDIRRRSVSFLPASVQPSSDKIILYSQVK